MGDGTRHLFTGVGLAIAAWGTIGWIATSSADANKGAVIGAICDDGWRSSSEGSGTCSHHGGIRHRVFEDPDGRPAPAWANGAGWFVVGGVGTALLSGWAMQRLERPGPATTSTRWDGREGDGSAPATLSRRPRSERSGGPTPNEWTVNGRQVRCEACGGVLVVRTRRSDGVRFIGCTGFPRCRHTQSLPSRS